MNLLIRNRKKTLNITVVPTRSEKSKCISDLLQQMSVHYVHYLFNKCIGYFQKLKSRLLKKFTDNILKGESVLSDMHTKKELPAG